LRRRGQAPRHAGRAGRRHAAHGGCTRRHPPVRGPVLRGWDASSAEGRSQDLTAALTLRDRGAKLVSVRIVPWALAPLFAILLVLRLGSLIDAVGFGCGGGATGRRDRSSVDRPVKEEVEMVVNRTAIVEAARQRA